MHKKNRSTVFIFKALQTSKAPKDKARLNFNYINIKNNLNSRISFKFNGIPN